ncbi:MAG: ABC transporter ATP-binding protein, partial [Natronosporangium sp.]
EARGWRKAGYRQRAVELLGRVGLTGFLDNLPDELSGGMRQRVSVVRALLHDPPLLLMDEPFASLDLLTRDQMTLDFQRLCMDAGKTILFVTHSVSEAVFLADRVVVLTPRPGRIAEIFQIDLPRPRRLADRAGTDFGRYEAAIRSVLERHGILTEVPQ